MKATMDKLPTRIRKLDDRLICYLHESLTISFIVGNLLEQSRLRLSGSHTQRTVDFTILGLARSAMHVSNFDTSKIHDSPILSLQNVFRLGDTAVFVSYCPPEDLGASVRLAASMGLRTLILTSKRGVDYVDLMSETDPFLVSVDRMDVVRFLAQTCYSNAVLKKTRPHKILERVISGCNEITAANQESSAFVIRTVRARKALDPARLASGRGLLRTRSS